MVFAVGAEKVLYSEAQQCFLTVVFNRNKNTITAISVDSTRTDFFEKTKGLSIII
jgi:hypothetical protein